MTGKDRILSKLRGPPTDSLALMPITMMFAAELAGVRYDDYARDHRVLTDAQVAVADRFGFDYVSAISDPARYWMRRASWRVCACPTRPRPDECVIVSRRCGCWRSAPARRGSSKDGWKGRAR